MKSRISPVLLVILVALLLSASSFFLLWNEVSGLNESDIMFHFPASRMETLIFLAGPLLMLTPFLLAITIIGSYFLTKLWMKDIIINVVTETYEKTATINRTKYLTSEEKMVLNIIIKNQPEMLQSDLVKESKLPKHKITRMLDRFEQYDLVTREKYGITNMIRLKIHVEPLDTT
jgi:uncharacterized membrane protein